MSTMTLDDQGYMYDTDVASIIAASIGYPCCGHSTP